jgi:hypothetical protein
MDNHLVDETSRHLKLLRIVAVDQGLRQLGDARGVALRKVAGVAELHVRRRGRRRRLTQRVLGSLKVPQLGQDGRTGAAIADDVHEVCDLTLDGLPFTLAGRGLRLQLAVEALPLRVERLDERRQPFRLHELAAEYSHDMPLDRCPSNGPPVRAGAVPGTMAGQVILASGVVWPAAYAADHLAG